MRMKKLLTISLFLFVFSSYAKNTTFFNYKNLNAIASLVCHFNKSSNDENVIYVNKFNIDKNQIDSNQSIEEIDLSGTCNAEFKNNEIVHFGNDLQLEIKNSSHISGKIGLNDIKIQMKNNRPYRLILTDSLLGQKRTLNLSEIQWAKNDSLIQFNSKNVLKIDLKGRVIASEETSLLKYQDITFYNIWSYNGFGCTSKVSEEKCFELSEAL